MTIIIYGERIRAAAIGQDVCSKNSLTSRSESPDRAPTDPVFVAPLCISGFTRFTDSIVRRLEYHQYLNVWILFFTALIFLHLQGPIAFALRKTPEGRRKSGCSYVE